MLNNSINRFFFIEEDKRCESNYPGLIDAIYIVFFSKKHYNNNLLSCLRGLDDSDYKLSSEGAHNKSDNNDEAEEGMCSHLCVSYQSKNDTGVDLNLHSLRVPIDYEKSSFTCKSQGQNRGYTYLSELKAILKERSSQVSELQHSLLNSAYKFGVLFRDANGNARLILDPDYDMKIEISEESGEGPTGSAAASINFSQISKIPPIYWRRKWRFQDAWGEKMSRSVLGSIDCSSGYTSLEDYVQL